MDEQVLDSERLLLERSEEDKRNKTVRCKEMIQNTVKNVKVKMIQYISKL